MTKKEIKVKSYRTKKGKRVKQFRRRIKIAAGIIAGAATVGGLIAAAKHKKSVGKLINTAKSKKTDFSIPENAKIPKIYTPDLKDHGFGPPNSTAGSGVYFVNNRIDDASKKILATSDIFNAGRQDKPGFFLTYINKITGKKEHLIKLSAATGEGDTGGRSIDAILTFVVPEDVDPRFIDADKFREKIKNNPDLIKAIVTDEVSFRDDNIDENRFQAVQKTYESFIKEGFPSTDKPKLIDLRKEYNKKFKN